MNDKEFNFRYVALSEEERKEIASIKKQYSPNDNSETKLERLRKLDFLAKNTALVFSLCFGIIGTLIFGLGLAMILEWKIIIWGVLIAIVGLVPTCFAYPVYLKYLRKGKEKYGEEIIKLSNELLNEKE